MAFKDLLLGAQQYFPKLQVKYKDQSPLMKLLGTLFFFDKGFMTDFTTTIGNTIYAPNDKYFTLHPVSGAVVFMHELVHLHDQNRLSKLWFQLTYMLPQILVLPALLLFLISWKIALPVVLLFLLPLPAYFRMSYEKRAYVSSIYTLYKLSQRLSFSPNLDVHSANFEKYFTGPSYYWMFPFKGYMNKQFATAIQKVQAGHRPYEDHIFDMLDTLIVKL